MFILHLKITLKATCIELVLNVFNRSMTYSEQKLCPVDVIINIVICSHSMHLMNAFYNHQKCNYFERWYHLDKMVSVSFLFLSRALAVYTTQLEYETNSTYWMAEHVSMWIILMCTNRWLIRQVCQKNLHRFIKHFLFSFSPFMGSYMLFELDNVKHVTKMISIDLLKTMISFMTILSFAFLSYLGCNFNTVRNIFRYAACL